MGINDVAAHLVPLEEVKMRSVFLDVCTTGPKDMFSAYGYESAVLAGYVDEFGHCVGVGDGDVADVTSLLRCLMSQRKLGVVAEITAPAGVFNAMSELSECSVSLVLRPWIWLWHEDGAECCEVLQEPDVSDYCDISEIDPKKWCSDIEIVLRCAFPSASVWPRDSNALCWFGAFERTGRMIAVVCVASPWIGECPRVASLAVLPDARGKHVGSALLIRAAKAAEKLSGVSGRRVVEVSAYVEEGRVLSLYKRLGFQRGAYVETIRVSGGSDV